jgi:hypothetical protein
MMVDIARIGFSSKEFFAIWMGSLRQGYSVLCDAVQFYSGIRGCPRIHSQKFFFNQFFKQELGGSFGYPKEYAHN